MGVGLAVPMVALCVTGDGHSQGAAQGTTRGALDRGAVVLDRRLDAAVRGPVGRSPGLDIEPYLGEHLGRGAIYPLIEE